MIKTTGKCPFCSKLIILAIHGENQSNLDNTEITADSNIFKYALWHDKPLCKLIKTKNNKKVNTIITKVMTDLIIKQLNKQDGYTKND